MTTPEDIQLDHEFGLRDSMRSRAELWKAIRDNPTFDVVIVGGGIHGAAVAQQCALNGLSVGLFERSDYAAETSSRSSKMVHGGLRYLEHGDLRQVIEGVRCREDLVRSASHLVRLHPFLLPVRRGDWWSRVKLSIGLALYGAFARRGFRWHQPNEVRFPGSEKIADRVMGYLEYDDGIMDDCRLVLETVLAARQEGAMCLNYAEVRGIHSTNQRNHVDIEVRCMQRGETLKVRAGAVVNCAGPWVAEVGGTKSAWFAEQLRFSRGIHLVFNLPWQGPALLLPMAERGRYYFVWPHVAGTLVGTTEREVPSAEREPEVSTEEVDELFGRIERDLPGSGLTRDRVQYAFCGVRTLPLRRPTPHGATSQISRRHIWHYHQGVFNLLGGKYTTAQGTAAEVVRRIMAMAGRSTTLASGATRLLPGAYYSEKRCAEFRERAEREGLARDEIERLCSTYGGRVGDIAALNDGLKLVCPGVVWGEVVVAARRDQAQRFADLVYRRLALPYRPNAGRDIAAALATRVAELGIADGEEGYQKYCDSLQRIQATVQR